MNTVARKNYSLPRNAKLPPRGRLVTSELRENQTPVPTDNVYYRQVQQPQAYVPYAPVNPVQPYGRPRPQYAPGDDTMMTLAIVGLVVTVMIGIPVGLFTGPAALTRANRLEHQLNTGRRPQTDRSQITAVRICAWISIVWGGLIALVWAFVLAMLLMLA
ncbi:MAG: hypothetical protein H6841_09885 [Planctomycetes bacterium]|nr:hypothetical protein [Planctomycetota bacterium]MCB9935693.1 hypothetical protein [Planctomycetota bacterium]